MDALDLTAWLGAEEPPELTAFKKKVIKLAKDHSTRFHCGSVRAELVALGIHDIDSVETKVPVDIKVPPFAFQVEVPLKELKDKDGDAQLQVVVETLTKLQKEAIERQGAYGMLTGFALDAAAVTEMTVRGPKAPNPSQPLAGAWMYASNDGRVRHFYEEARSDGRARDVDYYLVYVPDDPGTNSMTSMNIRRRPICGMTTWNRPTNTSSRAQARNCDACNRRYNARITEAQTT